MRDRKPSNLFQRTRKAAALHTISTLLGERAAERIVFDRLSAGAHNDHSRADEIARLVIGRLGVDSPGGGGYFSVEDKSSFRGMKNGAAPGIQQRPRGLWRRVV